MRLVLAAGARHRLGLQSRLRGGVTPPDAAAPHLPRPNRADQALVTGDAERLKQAVAAAIMARRMLDRAFAAAGRERADAQELRRLSPEYRTFEALVPAYWIDLIELAAVGDDQAIEILDAERESRARRAARRFRARR
jgi:hypothetical protein